MVHIRPINSTFILAILMTTFVFSIPIPDDYILYLDFNNNTNDQTGTYDINYSNRYANTLKGSSYFLDANWNDDANFNDSDYSTWAFINEPVPGTATAYINYTLPSTVDLVLWQYKTNLDAFSTTNITIPSICVSYSTNLQLKVRMDANPSKYLNVSCYNGAWNDFYNTTDGSGVPRFYEEQIYYFNESPRNYTIDRYNNLNNTILLNGVDEYLNTTFNTSSLDNFTTSMWIKLNLSNSISHLWDARSDATTGVRWFVRNNNTLGLTMGTKTFYTPSLIFNDTWYNVVSTFNNTHGTHYINGELSITYDISAEYPYNYGNALTIGARSFTSPTNLLDGVIDEFMLFDRALTDEEIYYLYSQSTTNISNISQSNENVTILINYTLNETSVTCGANTNVSKIVCNSSSESAKNGTTTIKCGITSELNETVEIEPYCYSASMNLTFYNESIHFDAINPIITHNFTNATGIYGHNLTAQINFSDLFSLYSWNVSVDGVQVDGAQNVGYDSLVYNLSYDISHLSAGAHQLTMRVADGHTAQQIRDYDVTNGLFNNYIQFEPDDNLIKIEQVDKRLDDYFTYEKYEDKYSFEFRPSVKKTKYTFIVTADEPIEIYSRPNTKYKEWLISGTNWIDFIGDGVDVDKQKIRQINDYTVEVDIELNKDKDTIQFESVGDLNIVEYNFTFYTINATLAYSDPTYERELNEYIMEVNITDTPYQYSDINATFEWNGTASSVSKTSTANYIYFTSNYAMPSLEVDETFPFLFNLTLQSNPVYPVNQTQLVYAINIDNCTNASYARALEIFGLDEVTLDNISNMTANVNLEINLNNATVEFGFEFSGSTNYSICIFPTSSTYNVDAIIEYGNDTYAQRKYYLNDVNLSNVTQRVDLYHLEDSIASDIILTVYDAVTSVRITDAFVKILRYYPGQDNETSSGYRTVEVEKTDVVGETGAKMILADVWYKFIVEYPAGTVKLDTDIEKILTTEKDLPIRLSSSALLRYDSVIGVSADVSCTESTQTCRFTWSDASNTVQKGELRVYQDTGVTQILIFSSEVESPASTIAYTIPGNITGNRYVAEGWFYVE